MKKEKNLKANKIIGGVVVGIMALLIGLVISIQISTVQGSDLGGLIPVSKAKAYEEKLKSVIAEKDEITKELISYEERMALIEQNKAEEDFFLKGVITDLEKYKIAAGVVDVHGPGIIITIDDPIPVAGMENDFSMIMANYELLLSLVNKLKDAGAEAISINEQRIIATTEISLAGSHVNINAVPTAPPYVVKAIGNSDTLYSTITIRYGIIDEMKNKDKYGLQVNIEKKDDVVIPRYGGIIQFKHATSVISKEKE